MDDKNDLTLEQQVRLLMHTIEQDREERAEEKRKRHSSTRLCVICATIAFIAVVGIGGLFLALASGLTIDTTTQTVEGDTAEINNNDGTWHEY